MTPDRPPLTTIGTLREPGARAYALITLGALVVLLLTSLDRGVGGSIGGLLAMTLGLAGLVFGWRMVPATVVIVLTISQVNWWGVPWPEYPFDLNDLMLCTALLAYLAAQFRLFSMAGNALPVEPGPYPTPAAPIRRPPGLVTDRELSFLGVLVAWVVFAQVLWALLPVSVFGVTNWPAVVRLFALAVLLAGGGLLTGAVFDYLGRRRAPPAEALQVLQDELWDETRAEQRALNRWLTWARLRARRADRPAEPR
jgi:hypothetical protein